MIRKSPVFIIFFALLITIFLQVSRVSAQEVPLTSPLTTPVTGPVTTPAHSVTLVGNVMYKQLGRLFSNVHRLIPARGVVVRVKNFYNPSRTFVTSTDQNGHYEFSLPKGYYQVMVQDTQRTFFVPPFKVVRVHNSVRQANFQGLLFPHF